MADVICECPACQHYAKNDSTGGICATLCLKCGHIFITNNGALVGNMTAYDQECLRNNPGAEFLRDRQAKVVKWMIG
jgi:hypothetical protein